MNAWEGALFGFVPSAAVAAAPLLPGSSLRQHDGRTSHSRKGNGTRKERRARRVAHSCCFSSICPPFSALPWLLLSAPAPCQLKDCESVPVGGPALVVCDRAHNWAKRVRRISCISSHTRTCEQLAACSSRQTDRQTRTHRPWVGGRQNRISGLGTHSTASLAGPHRGRDKRKWREKGLTRCARQRCIRM